MRDVHELIRYGPCGTWAVVGTPVDTDGCSLTWRVDSDPRVYLSELGRAPRLSPEDETALARRITDERCIASLEHLIWSNLALVVDVARRFCGRGRSLTELIDHGNIGLWRAAKSYDPAKDSRFSTYAGWFIKASIKHAMTSTGVQHEPAHAMTA